MACRIKRLTRATFASKLKLGEARDARMGPLELLAVKFTLAVPEPVGVAFKTLIEVAFEKDPVPPPPPPPLPQETISKMKRPDTNIPPIHLPKRVDITSSSLMTNG
jgi:hypothetical protein